MGRILMVQRASVALLVLLSLQAQSHPSPKLAPLSPAERKLRQGYFVQALVYRALLNDVKGVDGPVFLSVRARNPNPLIFVRVGYKGLVQPIRQLDSYRLRWKWQAQRERRSEANLHRGVELGIEGLRWINHKRVVVMAWSKVNPSSTSDYDYSHSENGKFPPRRVVRDGTFARKAFQLHRRGNRWRLVKIRTLFAGG